MRNMQPHLYDPTEVPSVSYVLNLLNKYSAPSTPGVKNPGNQFDTSRSPLSRAGGLTGMMSRRANSLSAKSTGGRMVPAQAVRQVSTPPAVRSLTPPNPLRPPKSQTPITHRPLQSSFKPPKVAAARPSPIATGLVNATSFLVKAPFRLPYAKLIAALGALGAAGYGASKYLGATSDFRGNIQGLSSLPKAYQNSVRTEMVRQHELRHGTSDFDPETSRRMQGIPEGTQRNQLNRAR